MKGLAPVKTVLEVMGSDPVNAAVEQLDRELVDAIARLAVVVVDQRKWSEVVEVINQVAVLTEAREQLVEMVVRYEEGENL